MVAALLVILFLSCTAGFIHSVSTGNVQDAFINLAFILGMGLTLVLSKEFKGFMGSVRHQFNRKAKA